MTVDRFSLSFTNCVYPELHRTHFTHRLAKDPIETIKGRESGAFYGFGTFVWSYGVHALSILAVKTALNARTDGAMARLEGGRGSPAITLNYSINKKIRWLHEMFSEDLHGRPIFHRMFKRTNSGCDLTEPTSISFNSQIIHSNNIEILINDIRVEAVDTLTNLFMQLSESWNNRKGKNVKTTIPPNALREHVLGNISYNHSPDTEITPKQHITTIERDFGRKYLFLLKQDILALDDSMESCVLRKQLRKQVESFCISAEMLVTAHVAERLKGGEFLYSCSSLIDKGLDHYFDTGWILVVRSMAQAYKNHGGKFKRLFFLENRSLNQRDINSVSKVFEFHLINGIAISVVPMNAVSEELNKKKNIALVGASVLLHTTDQQQWDLDLTSDRREISLARDRYEALDEMSVISFRPCESNNVKEKLIEIFGQTT